MLAAHLISACDMAPGTAGPELPSDSTGSTVIAWRMHMQQTCQLVNVFCLERVMCGVQIMHYRIQYESRVHSSPAIHLWGCMISHILQHRVAVHGVWCMRTVHRWHTCRMDDTSTCTSRLLPRVALRMKCKESRPVGAEQYSQGILTGLQQASNRVIKIFSALAYMLLQS